MFLPGHAILSVMFIVFQMVTNIFYFNVYNLISFFAFLQYSSVTISLLFLPSLGPHSNIYSFIVIALFS